MVKLYVVYGCHGAGKTTLVKNILLSDGENLQELENKFGKYTLSQNNKYIAIGKYSIKCGGADSLKSTKHYFYMIDYLIENYPKSIILAEGIFLSALFSNPLKQFLQWKYEKNVIIYQILLYTSLKTSYNRVLSRNNKKPKLENIKNKQKAVLKTFKKFIDLDEFNKVIINTENKTAREVVNEFFNAIK